MLLNTIPVFMTLFGFCSTALALDPSVSGLVKRAVTLDGTCGFTGGGSGKNYTCGSTKPCCSRFVSILQSYNIPC
jgi:hypothetical protein